MNIGSSINGLTGHLTLREISKKTKETLSEVSENNVITLEGYAEIFKRLSFNQDTMMYIDRIVLGEDVGNGTAITPEPANETMTTADQQPTFTVNRTDLTFSYPSEKEMIISVILDGSDILNNSGLVDGEVRYSSATVRFGSDVTLSYKRFPLRTITPLIDIEISWRFYFS